MQFFREAASKETCFSLYLEKGKSFIQLLWLLGFTIVAKKTPFLKNFCYHEKNPVNNSEKKLNKKKQLLLENVLFC